MTAIPDTPFWDFSLGVYGRQGVADACLALQDRHGLDVNLLLLCCFAGAQGRTLEPAEIARLMAVVEDWQRSVVQPLRATRRWLKTQTAAPADLAEALRTTIMARELEAERIEQAMLFDALGGAHGETVAEDAEASLGAANLRTYLDVLGVRADHADTAALGAIVRGACPALGNDEAASLFA